jgi:alanine racemase
MHETSAIHVNLAAIDHNMRMLRQMVGEGCAICPIVKADAYGLGAIRVAERLVQSGADMLAVYTPRQAAELARAGIDVPLLILMPVRDIARTDELYRGLISGKLHLTVCDAGHLDDLVKLTERFGTTIAIHLEVDTGMSRGGCPLSDAPALLQRIASSRRLHLAGVFTHFASAETADDSADRQLALFEQLLAEQSSLIPDDCLVHAASSFATLRHTRFHKTMVRVGLAWAGYGCEWMAGRERVRGAGDLQPAVSWHSRIIQVKTIEQGTAVGYGGTWTAKRRTRLGLVPVGYADGLPMGLGRTDSKREGAMVGVEIGAAQASAPATPQLAPGITSTQPRRVAYAPVVGAVNMDQISIDLTDLSTSRWGGAKVDIGSAVELIGVDSSAPNFLPIVARAAGTIPHEMLCRLNSRLPRVYQSASTVRMPAPVAAAAAG